MTPRPGEQPASGSEPRDLVTVLKGGDALRMAPDPQVLGLGTGACVGRLDLAVCQIFLESPLPPDFSLGKALRNRRI